MIGPKFKLFDTREFNSPGSPTTGQEAISNVKFGIQMSDSLKNVRNVEVEELHEPAEMASPVFVLCETRRTINEM